MDDKYFLHILRRNTTIKKIYLYTFHFVQGENQLIMKPFLKIDKRVRDLNDSQAFIYLMIVYNKFQNKQVNRRYLAETLGVTSKEYISDLISDIENAGLLTRANHFRHSYKEGWIDVKLDWVLSYQNYYEVDVDFVRNRSIDSRSKGFIIRYRCLAFDDTLEVSYSKKDSAKLLGVSTPTLRKYSKVIESNNAMSYFKKQVIKQEISDDQLAELKIFADSFVKKAKTNKKKEITTIERQCYWYMVHKLYNHLRCYDLYLKAVSGTLFHKNNKSNE